MKRSVISTGFLLLPFLASSANASSLRGNDNHSNDVDTKQQDNDRRLSPRYTNPLIWLDETSQDTNEALSCVIRQANVPHGQGLILTASSGSEVSLETRRYSLDHQRWIIYNRQNFQFGSTDGPAFNIINTDNNDKPYLSTTEHGNTDMYHEDDASGRQLWRFNRENNPTIFYDHQTQITVGGGVSNPNGELGTIRTRVANWGGEHHVQLVRQDDVGSSNYAPVTWELIDCYQTVSPGVWYAAETH